MYKEDSKRLAQSVEDAQDEVRRAPLHTHAYGRTDGVCARVRPGVPSPQIVQMKNDVAKRIEKAKVQDVKYREMPDIVVKVVCRYRAELYFRISRKTKLARLFNAWAERMSGGPPNPRQGPKKVVDGKIDGMDVQVAQPGVKGAQYVFTHSGRAMDAEQSPEEASIEDGDEILVVELMDLTVGPGTEELVSSSCAFGVLTLRQGQDAGGEPHRETLKKNWTDDPEECVRVLH